ncbi:stemmadenine O-acetyltransferase-like [Tripterygium wilfordii]|uniref:stemmadenine O-acetyltransferase-like n=1 Tax=Tripterygium wilfordii TaxID=458696 RepID=UPI0018F82CBD|nr:stemmadenine O-acetyltransferase-like [Tripterygium wilfordii]
MEVERISKALIKPSSPTPNHLKNHKISFLDQFGPPGFAPVVVFYSANQEFSTIVDCANGVASNAISKRSQALKQSLSEALARYYILAGKVNDDLSIDCNDEGVPYIEARANCRLDDYLSQIDVSTLLKFLPEGVPKLVIPGCELVLVQETVFDCGGIALGFLLSHTIFDAATISTFLRTWSALARRSIEEAFTPNFIASSIFPSNNSFPEDANGFALVGMLFKTGKFATRRFIFDGSAIANLKKQATSSAVQNPSRVEVVSSLIIKRCMDALKDISGTQKSILRTYPVNLRRKATPPLPETCVGNLLLLATSLSKGEEELDDLVCQMREATSTIDDDLLNSLQGDGGLSKFLDLIQELRELFSESISSGAEHIGINSWCNFGFYNVDFGWGKPLWFPVSGLSVKNYIFLMDTRHGNGVEAWVSLDEEVMAVLEQDKELLSLASMDPNPAVIAKP